MKYVDQPTQICLSCTQSFCNRFLHRCPACGGTLVWTDQITVREFEERTGHRYPGYPWDRDTEVV